MMEKRYRAIRKDDPYLPARHALAIARDAEEAWAQGLSVYGESEVTIGDETFTVEVEPDWDDSFDGDCYGEVIDRYPHPDYVFMPQYDRADDETVIALDDAHGYVIDRAAESVSALAQSWSRVYGASRSVCRDLARENLRTAGNTMLRAMNGNEEPAYLIVVRTADGEDFDTLGGVELSDDDRGSAYLWETVRDMAGEVVYNRAARIEREARELEESALRALSATMLAAVS